MNAAARSPILPLADLNSSSSRWRRAFRSGHRLFCFLLLLSGALWDYARSIWLQGRHGDLAVQSAWLSRWSRQALALLGIRLRTMGQPATGGMVVANHLSHLDVVVLAALHPCVFVSKSEVRSWPVLGFMARLAGTLFIDRAARLDVARLSIELTRCVRQGAVVVIFPEGTSTDGRGVLPFHCALLEPAASNGWGVTPAWLGYSLADGSLEQDVSYWGRMVFLPHFLNLLSKQTIMARVHFGTAITCAHRKRLGRRLREAVLAFAQPASKPGDVETREPRPGRVVQGDTAGSAACSSRACDETSVVLGLCRSRIDTADGQNLTTL